MKPSPLHIGENDKVMEKEDANPQVPSGQKPGNSLMKLALFWLFFFAPAVAFLFLILDESLNMIGWIMIPIYFVFVLISYLISRNTSERGTGSDEETPSWGQAGMNPLTEVGIGLMGSKILLNAMDREKREAGKRQYDSLYWQESIRDKNPRHDFDYDHLDD